jgi:hypothetical protein
VRSSRRRSKPAPSAPDLAELAALVGAQPLRAQAAKNGQPSDLTNLLLVGSAETIARSFLAAGWTRALFGGVKVDSDAFSVELNTMVDRPQVPRSGVSAAGDRIETDGAIAAIVLR